MSARNDPLTPCCFCNSTEDNELQYGKFYEHDGIVTHYYCLLLSSNMAQKGKDEDGILGFLPEDIQKELRRGKRLVCSYCRKIGATLGCCNVRCKRIFHLPCGLKSNSLHQFFGEFRSYCVNHRPKQNIDNHILTQSVSSDNTLCCICYDKIDPTNLLKILWAPCCKKDAWFHRKCVQQLALSAGYFFKCPLCNNNKDFEAAMLEHGIFIPSQDASWELVPNAFEELLYRHNRCDAVKCLCPKGRTYTSSNAIFVKYYSKWELALCQTCGSQGIHKSCGQLKWANPIWECAECTSILNNSENNEDSNSDSNSESSSLKNSDLDSDSDTDISVGTEFPLLHETKTLNCTSYSTSESFVDSIISLKLRPGPRSFKLRQLLEAEKLLEVEKPIDRSNSSNIIDKLLPKESQHIKVEETETSKKNISKENLQESAKDDSQKEQFSNSKKSQPSPQRKNADIITIETDDDDDEVQIISLNQETDSSTPLQSTQSDTSLVSLTDSKSLLNKTASSVELKPITINILKTDATPLISTPNMISLNNDDLQDTNETDTNESSMNIKISNVTSLPAEVFESVPDVASKDVKLDINSVETLNSPVNENKLKEVVLQVSPPKRNIYEENNAAKHCKKIKVNNFNKRFLGSYTNRPTVIVHNINGQENEKISTITSTKNCEDNRLSCTSANKISNLSQNNDSPTPVTSFQKTNIRYTGQVESNSSVESSNVQQSEGSTMNMIINNNPIYIRIPQKRENVHYKSISNTNLHTQSTSNQEIGIKNAYNMLSSNVILPQVKKNQQIIATANNNQITLVTQPTTVDAIVPTTVNKNQTEALDKQKSDLGMKIVPVNVSSPGNNSLNYISCDGDAGTDRTGTNSADEREDPSRESCGRSINGHDCCVNVDCRRVTTRSIFPQVTNNHNTCHQPRLTPQYMNLKDLKFQVCGSGSVQMVLYDTFSVNIPLDRSRKRKIRPTSSVTPEPKRLCTPASRSRSEASSSFDHSDGASTAEYVDKVLRSTRNENHLVNDKARCITRGRDEAKENLDPVKSKTLSRRFCNVNLSEADEMVIKSSCVCGENDGEIRVISSDNPSALNRTNCNTNADNVADGFVSSDRNQNLRINLEDVKQPNQVCSMEEENDGAKSFNKEAIHNFDLNIINANKSAEKVLHDNITASTGENQHVDDNKITITDRTNDTSRLWNNNKHLRSTNIRKLKAQNQSVAQVSNVIINDTKQIGTYNSEKFTRCGALNKSFINCNSNNESDCSDDSFKISIDLNKIRNIIDAKPELFVNEKRNDEQHKCSSQQANSTQQQMVYNIANKNINDQSLKNGELQIPNDTSNVKQNPVNRDTFSNMNTFASYQKPNVALDNSTNVSLTDKITRKKLCTRNRNR
nr:PREDICTED: uncharacterized protein LOC105678868 isoform X1 [Linepithema humile]